MKKLKEKDIIRGREYVHPDSYAFVVRHKKTNKFILSGWSEEETEKKLQKLL